MDVHRTYGQKKLELLRRFLPFENGTPGHDQLGNLFSRLDMEVFQSCFISWVASLNETLEGVVAVDGKTLRRSFDTSKRQASIHMVSAWACDQKLVLGQRKVDDKSNEIPELLELLNINGAIVTIDAMGCQRKICQQVDDKGADYVIGLKGNQCKFRKDFELQFDAHLNRDIGGDFVTQIETVGADHGRIETRRHTVCWEIDWLRDRHNRSGLESIVKTEFTRKIKGEIETERRFHISSLTDSPEKMARYIRDHWQVENCLHWVLDVTFRQDDCRIRKENVAANFTTINHAAINLLKRVSGKKMSIPQKRRSAAWDDDYMEVIIRQ